MAVKALEDIYNKHFFSKRHKLNWRAPIVCDAIKKILKPLSVIDVGCATGDLVCMLERNGIHAFGIEGSVSSFDYLQCCYKQVFYMDLRQELPQRVGWYDLATCFEVAEHIEPEFAEIFVDNLERLSDRILMSAASPGQGGHYHVNCRPAEYWIEMFERRNYEMKPDIVDEFRKHWNPWRNKKEMRSYYDNLLFFEAIK